jgi:GT2 family glycosyltransferase
MINHPDIGLCGGRSAAVFESEPPAWFDDFQNAYAVGPQGTSSGYLDKDINRLYGAGMTLRKSAWDHLEKNGFTYKLTGRKGKKLSSGEDTELCLALQLAGYRLWYETTLTFFHYMPATRLSYASLKKLFRAFGDADVVIAIYHSYLRQHDRLRNTIIRNYLLCLLYDLYKLAKLLFRFLVERQTNIIRMRNHLDLIRGISRTAEQFKMFGKYSGLVKSIGKAKWINDKYRSVS